MHYIKTHRVQKRRIGIADIPRVALVALSALAFPASAAFAQVLPNQGPLPRSNEGSAHERTLPTCQTSGGGTRTRANCEADPVDPTVVRTELEFKLPTVIPAMSRAQCEVIGETAYQQRNAIARVNSKLEITDCKNASGEFTISLRVRDESGESKTLEFTETWERSDGEDPTFTSDYPLGDNVVLLRARMHNLSCTCADEVTEN